MYLIGYILTIQYAVGLGITHCILLSYWISSVSAFSYTLCGR